MATFLSLFFEILLSTWNGFVPDHLPMVWKGVKDSTRIVFAFSKYFEKKLFLLTKWSAAVLFSQTDKKQYVLKSGYRPNPVFPPVPSNLKNLSPFTSLSCFL